MKFRRRVSTESPEEVTQIQPSMNATSATPMIEHDDFFGKPNGNGNGGRGFSKVGEAVGGTAAVICCFPLTVINLVVLAVYKVPIGLWKRAWNRRRRQKKRRLLLSRKNRNSASMEGFGGLGLGLGLSSEDEEEEREVDRLEEEMYDQFYRGFWRSPSLKGD